MCAIWYHDDILFLRLDEFGRASQECCPAQFMEYEGADEGGSLAEVLARGSAGSGARGARGMGGREQHVGGRTLAANSGRAGDRPGPGSASAQCSPMGRGPGVHPATGEGCPPACGSRRSAPPVCRRMYSRHRVVARRNARAWMGGGLGLSACDCRISCSAPTRPKRSAGAEELWCCQRASAAQCSTETSCWRKKTSRPQCSA